tara:strand:- start:109 stop:1185 length:1077 start_codon:yes stop_codon:yes gene_type:complete
MSQRNNIIDLTNQPSSSSKPEYPHCHFIDYGSYKTPPTGFLDDDYAKILVLKMRLGNNADSLNFGMLENVSWMKGKFYNDAMKENMPEVIQLETKNMQQMFSWVESASRVFDKRLSPGAYKSSLPYAYDNVQICTVQATRCIFTSQASEYHRNVNRHFVHQWDSAVSSCQFGILEGAASYKFVYKCQPMACLVHNADAKHFTVAISVDGIKWYHYDSMQGNANSFAVERGLENARQMLAAAHAAGAISNQPPNRFDVVHMTSNPGEYKMHVPALQNDNVSCLLYAIATLDFFICTRFDTFPVTERFDVACINQGTVEMRKFCLELFHDSYAYYNHLRLPKQQAVTQHSDKQIRQKLWG